MYEIEGRVNQIELPPSTCSPAIDHEVDEPEALLSSPANNLLETAAPHKQITVLSTDARCVCLLHSYCIRVVVCKDTKYTGLMFALISCK